MFMAGLMFLTSPGFAIDKHFCQGELKDIRLFGKAKSCHEAEQAEHKPACPFHPKLQENSATSTLDEKDCCTNQATYVVSGEKTSELASTKSAAHSVTLLYAILPVDKTPLPEISYSSLHYLNYKPPLLNRDIPVLVQSFLL